MKAFLTLVASLICLSLSAQVIFPVAAKRGKIGGGSAPFDTVRVKVNLHASGTGVGAISVSGWNSKAVATGSNISVTSLLDEDGNASPITCTISAISNLNDNGSGYVGSSNTTEFDDGCFRMAPSNGSGPITFTYNSVPDGTYRIKFLPSRSVGSSRIITYSCQAATDTVESRNNFTDVAVLSGLVPSSGTISVTMNSDGTSIYFNSFIIERVQ